MIQLFITVILIILILVLIVNEFYFYKKIETFQTITTSTMAPTTSSTMAPTTTSSNMPPTTSSNSYPNMCKFVPWGKTINDCTSTCLNSRYKDLYSFGNPNCNIDVCKTTCDNCSTSRCLWANIPTTPVTNDYNEECININDTQNNNEITITINDAVSTTTTATTTTSVGSLHSYTYIIHYRDTENNNITILNLTNNDDVIFTVSGDDKINHKPKFLKPNKSYNLIAYKLESNIIKCKSNILNITTT